MKGKSREGIIILRTKLIHRLCILSVCKYLLFLNFVYFNNVVRLPRQFLFSALHIVHILNSFVCNISRACMRIYLRKVNLQWMVKSPGAKIIEFAHIIYWYYSVNTNDHCSSSGYWNFSNRKAFRRKKIRSWVEWKSYTMVKMLHGELNFGREVIVQSSSQRLRLFNTIIFNVSS